MIEIESLHEYFRKALGEALSRTNMQVRPEIQVYLIRMLLDFSRTEQAFSGVDHGEKPIYALMFARAQDSEPGEALRLYKQVGDSTLYHLGFFKESASDRAVSQRYYISLGEIAYASAANLAKPLGINATLIYNELADQFTGLVTVFNDMSLYGDRAFEDGKISTERLLVLIETYKRTNDPNIGEILVRHGVSIDKEPKKS